MVNVTRRESDGRRERQLDPFRGALSLRDAMDRLFDESFWSPLPVSSRAFGEGFPRVDISETEDEIRLRADVPGVDPENVDVEVTEDSISLSGKTERSEEEKKENYHRVERSYGEFTREFLLPAKIDPDSVKAFSKNGTITVTLKKQPSEQRKKVKVESE